MRPKLILLACVLACLLVGTVFGAVTGNIKGKVTDSKTKEPISGVSVTVKGTTLGAKTNLDGEYVIINVPVGYYELAFSSVGYSTLEVQDVHISADMSAFENRELTEEVTDLGKVVTVRADIPLVQPDKTTTVNIVTADELQALPVRGFEQAVSLQNSVVRTLINNDTNIRLRGQRESSASAGEINLRGGRPSEVAYYVDGFSQQDPLTGISSSNIANNAIQEVQVTSGAFSAEYGHVASGVVNVITKSGGDEYHGTVDIVTDNILSESFDQNYYSLDFGGPIPGLEKAHFFLSGERRWLGDRSPSVKTKEFYERARLDTNSTLGFEDLNRLPANSLSGWSGQAKLDYELTSNLKLALTGTGSMDDWQEYQHNYLFNYRHSPRYEDKNYGLNLKITHSLDINTYYNLSASYFMTERKRGDGVLFDDLESYRREFANPEWEFLNLFRDHEYEILASDADSTIIPGSPADTIITVESYMGGGNTSFLHRKSSYIGLKGDINKQIGLDHTVKVGFDMQRHTLRYYENLDPTNVAGYCEDTINRYGFDEAANENDNLDYRNDTKHPINLGVYVKDRFDWKGLIIDAGLRFDYFDYKALRIRDPEHPLDPGRVDSVDVIDRSDLEESKVFTRLSPRLGIGFPISDKTQFHVNYGKFFQRPDLVRLYVGYDFMATRIVQPGSYYPFASPNLEPEKITQYEVGVTHQLSSNSAVSITAYYKDTQDLTQIFSQIPATPQTYDFFSNTDYGTVKGIDINWAMRRSRNLRLDIKYTLSTATGTGSYAQSQYNVAWQNPGESPKSTSPLDYDKRHTMLGIFDFRTNGGEGPKFGETFPFEKLSLNVVVQASSGTPYTRMQTPLNLATEAAVNPLPVGRINETNLPWTFNIDLKLERKFEVGQYNIVPYLWVQNLLDYENVALVYESSGKPDVTGWLPTEEGQKFIEHPDNAPLNPEYMYQLKENNPRNYGPPRMILFGVRMAF
jgi:outer membrane receptor protein involved in Fe transport